MTIGFISHLIFFPSSFGSYFLHPLAFVNGNYLASPSADPNG